jgi:hypothetical protein
MSLIATARAIDDARFVWRVNAALLSTAAAKVSEPEGASQWFAEYVLDNPMAENKTAIALVAVNGAIASTVVVDSFNTVNTEGVSDSDILYVVATEWDKLAARHDERTNPAPATGATTTV